MKEPEEVKKLESELESELAVKEVKLVYESLNSTLTKKETNRSSIKESLGFASKPSGLITQTNNSKVIDSDIQIDRWAKLAGLK